MCKFPFVQVFCIIFLLNMARVFPNTAHLWAQAEESVERGLQKARGNTCVTAALVTWVVASSLGQVRHDQVYFMGRGGAAATRSRT